MKCKIGHNSPECKPILLSGLSCVYEACASKTLGTRGPTQAEKAVKISVILMGHLGAVLIKIVGFFSLSSTIAMFLTCFDGRQSKGHM